MVKSGLSGTAILWVQKAQATACDVGECIEAYIAAKRLDLEKGTIAKTTFRELQSKMRVVRKGFAGKKIIEIDEAAVGAFIQG